MGNPLNKGVGAAQDVINSAIDFANMPESDNPLAGSFLEKWFTPGDVQKREFGQQMAAQQMQNEWQAAENAKWNDEREKYKRLKELGVNDLTIAEGLAGSSGSPNSPSSVGSVPSTPDGISPQDVVGAVNAVTGGAASLADAAFKNGTLEPTIANLNQDVENKLASLGLTNEEIYAWKVDNKYRDENAQVDLRIKLLNEKNTAKQWDVLHSQYELNTTKLDTELSEQRLNYETAKLRGSEAEAKEAEAAYLSKLKEKTDFEAQFAQIRVEFWKSHGFDILNSSTDAILVQKIENSQSIGNIVREMSDYYGKRVDAEEFSKARYVFTNSFNAAAGANNANFDYEWNIPAKTLAELASKGAVALREKLRGLVGNKNVSDLDKPTKEQLKQSFVEFQTQVQRQRVLLNLQRADAIEFNNVGKAEGINQSKIADIEAALSELEKLPKTFKEFVKYVQSN